IEFPPIAHLIKWPDIVGHGAYAINKTTIIYFLAVIITLAFFFAAGRKAQLVPSGVQNIAESSLDFIRGSVIMQTIGPDRVQFATFLPELFFFIFFTNIFEIIPGMQFPANARTAVPLVLAMTVWFIYNYIGISRQGFGKYVKGVAVPPGVPKALLILVTPIE